MAGDKKTVFREFTVLNKYGIHARPAALLVKAAGKFSSEIFIGRKGMEVSAKSIMGLLTIEGHHGARITVRVVGLDAEEALAAIAALFENKFFEE
ncbi:MAG: HPr family phosphocarrier protein [Pontiellaceae bacterium]|jgi:phosphocarrier protein|nr:HPr family phosphocarrier protein [Pontiellaceae bacterium]